MVELHGDTETGNKTLILLVRGTDCFNDIWGSLDSGFEYYCLLGM
jgi:hypothetical protein